MGSVRENPSESPPPRKCSRRAFLLGGVSTVGVVGGLGAYTRYVEPFWTDWTRHEMDLPGLAPAFAGWRTLHLTDLHVASAEVERFLTREFDRCAESLPDLIFLTGDYLTGGNPDSIKAVGRVVRRLKARHGIFASLGNHDYYDFTGRLPRRVRYSGVVADDLSNVLRNAGIHVLRNSSYVLRLGDAELQIVGLEDWMVGRFDANRAFGGVDSALPTIALSHNPDTITDLSNRPCHWILAGHTHGGQVRVPGIGALRLPVLHREYDEGQFVVNGRKMYVNRGIGYLAPLRFNCRPEIAEFTLTLRTV